MTVNYLNRCRQLVSLNINGKSEVKVTQSCPTLCNPIDYTVHGILQARILEWVAFPFSRGSSQPRNRIQNTGVGSLSLLQGIFPTQESNPRFPHCRQILYQLSHEGSPRILDRVFPYPFPSGSSRPRNQTRVSCIAGRLFTNLATREAQY